MEKNEKDKKNIIIGVLAFIIVLLGGLSVYALFIKKNDNVIDNEKNNQQNINSVIVKKKLDVFAFNVILDINGNAYLDLREDNVDKEKNAVIVNLFNKAETYNYDNKSEKLIKINLQNIKDIQVLNFGDKGGKYIIFIDSNDKAYVLIDYKVVESGNIQLLTDDKLNKVKEINYDCTGDSSYGGNVWCSVFASAIVNGKEEIVEFYNLFEKYNPVSYDELKNNLKKYNPSYAISENKAKEISLSPMNEKYNFVLSADGKITISKNGGKKVTISNITNAINIDYINDIVGRVYILLSNGDVYEYTIDEFEEEKYVANKISAIKNAIKFVKISYVRCHGCGADMNLGVLNNNNQYIELDTYSV